MFAYLLWLREIMRIAIVRAFVIQGWLITPAAVWKTTDPDFKFDEREIQTLPHLFVNCIYRAGGGIHEMKHRVT